MTVLFWKLPKRDNLSASSIALDSPTLHWMMIFRIVSIAVFPLCSIVVVRSVLFDTIVSHEYINQLCIDPQLFKKFIRL